VDLSLDTYLYSHYSLAKQIYSSFGDDFDLANASDTKLPYDPHSANAESERVTTPAVYWQQGVPIGILDNAVQALIVKDPQGTSWVMSFAEFEIDYERSGSSVQRAFDRIRYLFEDFHPRTRPVLWRILIAQAHLYRALLQTRSGEQSNQNLVAIAKFPPSERKQFDWRGANDQVEESVVLEQPFDIAEKYLRQPIARIAEKLASRSPSA
jgi:hypothetical protein